MSEEASSLRLDSNDTAIREQLLREYAESTMKYKEIKRELKQMEDTMASLLSLHNKTATKAKLSVTIPLGVPPVQTTIEVMQVPGRGVGAVLWQASVVLAEAVSIELSAMLAASTLVGSRITHCWADRPTGMSDAVVIELGAGCTALPSLTVASMLPASARVNATDLPDVVPWLRTAIERYQEHGYFQHDTLFAEVLCWDQPRSDVPLPESSTQQSSTAAGLLSHDGIKISSTPQLQQRQEEADLLLGADILYAVRCYDDLVQTIDTLLRPDGVLMISYAIRSAEAERLFFDLLLERTGVLCSERGRCKVDGGQTILTVRGQRVGRQQTSDGAVLITDNSEMVAAMADASMLEISGLSSDKGTAGTIDMPGRVTPGDDFISGGIYL